MNRDIRSLPLDLIKLDQENVRFGNDVAQSQREAINLLMEDPEDAKKLLKLAEHIVEFGLDPTELQLVTPDGNGSFIVLEGNRRLTAMKLLQRPDLCPAERLVKGFLAAHNKLNGSMPSEIDCSVVATRADGDVWLEIKHTGQNGGVGRVPWDSDIRDERRARQTGIESIGRQIRNLVNSNPQHFSQAAITGVSQIAVTTLTRLFSSVHAQECFKLKIEDKHIKPEIDLKYIAPSVEYAVNLFIDSGYNVNDIRSDENRQRFVGLISEEIKPEALFEADKKKPKKEQGGGSAEPHHKPEKDEGSNNAGDSSDTKNGGGEQATSGPGTKAKPSPRARKYLMPWSLSIPNGRINEVYRELRKELAVDACPNATAVTFRVFIEVSCDDFTQQQQKAGTPILRSDNNKPLKTGAEDKLSHKVQSVVKHLETQGKVAKEVSKTIIKRASSTDAVGSVDHFNLFVHGSASSPVPSELKDIADEYRPMLEAIWK